MGSKGKGKRKAETGDDLPKLLQVAYKPFGLLSGLIGGLLAGQIFSQVWKRISKEPDTPEPLSPAYSTREVLLAATLQGAIFGLVKTAVDRYGMKLYRRAVEKPRPPSSQLPRG